MLKLLIFVLILSILSKDVQSARILGYIPAASYSHQVFFQELWRQLTLQGHDLVVITTDPTGETLPNFREVSIQESYPPTKAVMDRFVNTSLLTLLWNTTLSMEMGKILEDQLELPQVQEVIQNQTEHFDLLMVEIISPLPLGFKHRFKCPMIGLVSFDAFSVVHAIVGNPTHAILYPSQLFPRVGDLNFLERVGAFLLDNIFYVMQMSSGFMVNPALKKYFGDDAPSMDELFESVDMLFINANPLFTPNRPLTPSTINLAGGIHMKPPKPLPKDLKDFLDSGSEGVVYFSLGSNVRSSNLPSELLQTIIETFKGLPYKVLWKFELEELPGKPKNVKIIKWAPQQDILRHENVKVFVTQGGVQSLEEALYLHVPMVTLPFFGDQLPNSEKVKEKGIGIKLDRYNLKLNEFKDAILDVMTNPKYKENIVKLAGTIQDQPQTAMERAIWWTEYVLRHKGGRHLRGPRIRFYQYYYLDIWAFLMSVLITFCGVAYGLIRCIIDTARSLLKKRRVSRPRKQKKL